MWWYVWVSKNGYMGVSGDRIICVSGDVVGRYGDLGQGGVG